MNIRANITPPSTRRSIEDAIERLLSLLDGMEADAELEQNGDEQDASWPEGYTGTNFGHACEDDEDGDDTEADSADAEPDLGWTEGCNQAAASLTHGQIVESGELFLGWSEAESEAGVEPTGQEFPHGAAMLFEGVGTREARSLLAQAKPRTEPKTIGERIRVLPNGELLRTFVLSGSGYVLCNRRKRR